NPLYLSYLTSFEKFQPVHAEKTLASAIQIGNPVSFNRAVKVLRQFNGVVEQASECELADEAARADRTGMFSCPHTGVTLAVLLQLGERKAIRSNERVVVISTAHGLKSAEQKTAYHMGLIPGLSSMYANRPLEIGPDPRLVQDAIRRHADKMRLMEA